VIKKILVISMLFMGVSASIVCASRGGDYRRRNVESRPMDPKINQYIQEYTYRAYIAKIGEVTKRIVIRQRIEVVPQIMQMAVYQVGLQAFNGSDIQKDLRDIYKIGIDVAQEQWDARDSNLQQSVTKTIDEELDLLVDTPLFKRIIETVIEAAMTQQRAVIMQKAAQQYYQQVIMQQKIMEKAIELKFKEMYAQMIKAQQMQQIQIMQSQ